MSEGYTKGPWIPGHMTDPESTCRCRYILCDGYAGSIAVVSKRVTDENGCNDSPPEEEAIANARLIAAAPELYEALKEMVSAFENYDRDMYEFEHEAIKKARAALSKAKGE